MEQMKIYPYLLDEKRITGYYEILLDNKYKLVEYEKKKDQEFYDYFLPKIRNFMFWTFNIKEAEDITKQEFSKMSNDLKSCTCGGYFCNIFEKEDTIVVCFETGICFAITKDDKALKKLKQYEKTENLEEINIRKEKVYDLPSEIKESDVNSKNPRLMLYILQIYKEIFLKKIQKEMQKEDDFEKSRIAFVKFTENIYNIEETDQKEEEKLVEKWKKELNIDKLYLKVENQYDLLYRNNKLNYNSDLNKFCIALFIVAIIIGIINLSTLF